MITPDNGSVDPSTKQKARTAPKDDLDQPPPTATGPAAGEATMISSTSSGPDRTVRWSATPVPAPSTSAATSAARQSSMIQCERRSRVVSGGRPPGGSPGGG